MQDKPYTIRPSLVKTLARYLKRLRAIKREGVDEYYQDELRYVLGLFNGIDLAIIPLWRDGDRMLRLRERLWDHRLGKV